MASNYSDIQKAFETKLALLTDLPIIVPENTTQSKIQTDANGVLQTKYIRTSMLPAVTEDLTVGVAGFDKYHGIYQIDIFTPYDNGIDESNYWVDEIINHFKQADQLSIGTGSPVSDDIVRVISRSKMVGLQSTNYHQQGVELYWESYLAKA